MKKQTSFLTEWDKIKDANICTLEEFEILFSSNPKGRCFRKYTSYPWSKENFFFGTYEDFSHFQKTTTEIPFYLSNKVGSKVFNLTILSFFRDESNKICANCRCDCGNEVIKSYDAISKGNARSCGCNKGRKANETKKLVDLIPNTIKTYWDFDKNICSPEDISIDSEDEYWWKGYSHSYKMPISYFLRSASGTSFPEQTIRFFLVKNNIEVVNRHIIIHEKQKYELDLFLPLFKIGIEYDGAFWHSGKVKTDLLKNKAVERTGITFVRIREKGLPKTGIKHGLEIMMQESMSDKLLSNVVNELFEYIEIKANIKLEKITANDISKNKSLIQSQYSIPLLQESVANSWLDKFWSQQNKEDPCFVSIKSSNGYYFNCPHGLSFFCSPKYLISKSKSMKSDPSLNCVFAYAFLCQRALRVINGLSVSILDIKYYLNNSVEIIFNIENRNDTSFYPISLGQYSIFENENLISYGGENGCIEKVDSFFIEKPSEMICPPFYQFSPMQKNYELLSFSKATYKLKINLERKLVETDDVRILATLNIADQVNFVYKICLYSRCFKGKTTWDSKIYTWDAYRHITKNQTLKLDYILNEEEAEALLAEF